MRLRRVGEDGCKQRDSRCAGVDTQLPCVIRIVLTRAWLRIALTCERANAISQREALADRSAIESRTPRKHTERMKHRPGHTAIGERSALSYARKMMTLDAPKRTNRGEALSTQHRLKLNPTPSPCPGPGGGSSSLSAGSLQTEHVNIAGSVSTRSTDSLWLQSRNGPGSFVPSTNRIWRARLSGDKMWITLLARDFSTFVSDSLVRGLPFATLWSVEGVH